MVNTATCASCKFHRKEHFHDFNVFSRVYFTCILIETLSHTKNKS